MHRIDKYSKHSSILWNVRLNCWGFVYELNGPGFECSCSQLNFRLHACFKQGFLDIRATIECRFTLKHIRDNTRTYNQTDRTDMNSEHSSVICPVCINGSLFVYKISSSGFESSCSHLNFRFRACFKQGVPWYSGNYRVWIHSETRTWHDKNIQSNVPYR